MPSETKRYNGWTNYETWNVALWIDNDEGSYSMSREMAEEAYRDAEADSTSTQAENAASDLADRLKDWIEEQNPLADQASVFSDLLSAALSEVNWHEIAENYLSDLDTPEIDAEDAEEESEADETL